MVRTDWDRIFALNPASLTDEEIEDLCPAIIHCQVEEINDAHNLRTLVKLSQESLQYKDSQVESLLLECGELKGLVSSLKSQVAKREGEAESRKYGESFNENFNHQDGVRKESEKIESLMAELETVERENSLLKENLAMLKEEMVDATEKMNRATEELNISRRNTAECAERISTLEAENSALLAQIEEISAEQTVKDKIIDEFGTAIDARINEWKAILVERDGEIASLRENLSRNLIMASARDDGAENRGEISSLVLEVHRREEIIGELQRKLAESVLVINENAGLLEKLRIDARKAEKAERKSGQRSLLEKLRGSNERIKYLQGKLQHAEEELDAKSAKLCEVLSILRKYEDKDFGLADALSNVKFLENELRRKSEHVEDLIGVVNKLEMLNSYQQMEILTLRDKLGISKDEEVPIEGPAEKSQEQAMKLENFIAQNKMLIRENIEMKSDIRALRHKLKRSKSSSDDIDAPSKRCFLHSTGITEDEENEISIGEAEVSFREVNVREIERKTRLIVEENEALRQGMHEIFESIQRQDGKSSVEVHSTILERLLEALDVRHLAGWYHPAMRLQERLNVVQGSNSELRDQVKQLRKDLRAKDDMVRDLFIPEDDRKLEGTIPPSEREKGNEHVEKATSKLDYETVKPQNEERLGISEDEGNLLARENEELQEEIRKLREELSFHESNWRIIESGQDDVRREFVKKSKETWHLKAELEDSRRKEGIMEEILAEESSKMYKREKEFLLRESNMEKLLVDAEKRCGLLEREISALGEKLSDSVSFERHERLRGEYLKVCTRLRGLAEDIIALGLHDPGELFRTELEILKDHLGEISCENFVEERRRRRGSTELLESGKEMQELVNRLESCREELKVTCLAKADLQEQLLQFQSEISRSLRAEYPIVKRHEDVEGNELRERIDQLETERDVLQKKLEISEEESRLQFNANAMRTLELDNLRHQIVDLQALSEDKATISRLSFELANVKAVETELADQKSRLETQVGQLRAELGKSREKFASMQINWQEWREQWENRCKYYREIIEFLQERYSCSTTISSLERVLSLISKLKIDRQSVNDMLQKAKVHEEHCELQRELLVNRLEIVDKLKDILERQIGNSGVQEILHEFSINAQCTLSNFKYNRRIRNLENDLQMANEKIAAYELNLLKMEEDMMDIQRVWQISRRQNVKSTEEQLEVPLANVNSVSIQAEVEKSTESVQTDFYKCCLTDGKEPVDATNGNSNEETAEDERDEGSGESSGKAEESKEKPANVVELEEKLRNALQLLSEKSSSINDYLSQIVECRANVENLSKIIREKDAMAAEREKAIEDLRLRWRGQNFERGDGNALKSTINSLQKIIDQKEETIVRYQNMLKEDRIERNKSELLLQEELDNQRRKLAIVEEELQRKINAEGFVGSKLPEMGQGDFKKKTSDQEELARMTERLTTLEAELNFTKELGERWRRLAEERLQHVDEMREKLEEQHKEELECYRVELRKWQSEADSTRRQLSESRMLLAKGNISISRELQDRDDRINELALICEKLKNEVATLESASLAEKSGRKQRDDSSARDVAGDANNREQSRQSQLRRQLQTLMEKEKSYKHEIADLKQKLSCRYMAMKAQEKKTSQRELQLERKVKTLEEELQRAQVQLDREFVAQEYKRVKTAEELNLWDKQKRWQETAEKLKEKLQEKTEECKKLQSNCERLKSVISSLEREKWCLRGRVKAESAAGSLSARPVEIPQDKLMTDLRDECKTLENRVSELTEQLQKANGRELAERFERQKRRLEALEIAAKDNNQAVDELERLARSKEMLERANVKLEADNFQLRFDAEKSAIELPKLKEKVDHLTKYVELLKTEKLSNSGCISSDSWDICKKSGNEVQKTIFALRRVIERLQAENKRLKMNSKGSHRIPKEAGLCGDVETLQTHYEEARKRSVALEVDLQLAEQRIAMLEIALRENDVSGEKDMLRQQLLQKSNLLDRVKQLLAKAAINERNMRRRIQQLESRQVLSAIPECCASPATSGE